MAPLRQPAKDKSLEPLFGSGMVALCPQEVFAAVGYEWTQHQPERQRLANTCLSARGSVSQRIGHSHRTSAPPKPLAKLGPQSGAKFLIFASQAPRLR